MAADKDMDQAHIQRLLAALTLEEKCFLVAGKNMWETASVPRLGIASIKTTDGPAGVRGATWTDGTHTTYIPCGIALAATFDGDLVERVGQVLGAETRSKGAHVLLAPTMNSSRSPLGGRNFENWGEDPLLTGVLAAHYIRGVQTVPAGGRGVGACMKHYVANDMETRRFNMDEAIDTRTLHEIYLRPFGHVLRRSDTTPWTAMAAYPRINGAHADASRPLLDDVLRRAWHFDRLVMSDWGGLNDTVDSLVAGTDLEMPGPPIRYGQPLLAAVQAGRVTEHQLDQSVRRVLELVARAGALQTEKAEAQSPEQDADLPAFRQTARDAATGGIVLLQNDNDTLPLDMRRLGRLAVIGPNAATPTTGGSGSASVNPYYVTTPLGALTEAAQKVDSAVEIVHAPGILTNAQTGQARLFVDGMLVIDNAGWTEAGGSFMNCGSANKLATLSLQAGQSYRFRVDNVVVPPPLPPHDNTLFHTLSGLRVGLQRRIDEDGLLAAAVEAARSADAVVLVLGHNNDTEKEGVDRTSLALPRRSDELVAAMAHALHEKDAFSHTHTPFVVVVQSACAVAMPWAGHVPAIIQAWYQGQENGNALADVLLGRVSPSGRLPVTFPRRLADHGSDRWFPGDVAADRAVYGEGVLVGYRWFDAHQIEPLWPFGFDLSYSSFRLDRVAVSGSIAADRAAHLSATVTNTGGRDAAHVVQVYIAPSPAIAAAGLDVAPRTLAAFAKIAVPAGQARSVSIALDRHAVEWFDVAAARPDLPHDIGGAWRVDPGVYTCYVGSSSRHFDAEVSVVVE
ncbi:beta-glucosidase [Grosmannia clavigera kw1407]|uniref:beta-glucosidase n=1 Tax=Grosmannia clavigera (strain kw1407 / UAMH 11150) TaxID=655863 RepID=F0XJ64_GROCL|nr:beta-glucosidase [Grosmannia clavigera kw1407]EFX02203.1 beta-glucosidase [Grosmannia clavigera kw1407]